MLKLKIYLQFAVVAQLSHTISTKSDQLRSFDQTNRVTADEYGYKATNSVLFHNLTDKNSKNKWFGTVTLSDWKDVKTDQIKWMSKLISSLTQFQQLPSQ